MPATPDGVARAARALESARAVLVGAGAGMGVDSGLPDFRGDEGFWRAYPAFRRLGLSFVELADPTWFVDDPPRAWGFYGHRLHLYRRTTPHAGFDVLRRWAERTPGGVFVYTSNVDGQFQKAGLDPAALLECHGSIHHLQCAIPCSGDVWSGHDVRVDVDDTTMRAREPLPRCGRCGGLARPNILMFNDSTWVDRRTAAQQRRYADWLAGLEPPLAVVECGAGRAVPSVRVACDRVARRWGAPLVRINPREHDGDAHVIGVPLGALDALVAIDGAAGGARPGRAD